MTDFIMRMLLVSAGVSIVANMIVEKDHRDTAWIEGFAIFMTVAISATVQAGNEYQKEKQFKALQKFANSKKKVSTNRISNSRSQFGVKKRLIFTQMS